MRNEGLWKANRHYNSYRLIEPLIQKGSHTVAITTHESYIPRAPSFEELQHEHNETAQQYVLIVVRASRSSVDTRFLEGDTVPY
jgi:hypothetical protein